MIIIIIIIIVVIIIIVIIIIIIIITILMNLVVKKFGRGRPPLVPLGSYGPDMNVRIGNKENENARINLYATYSYTSTTGWALRVFPL